jgi:VanZ family protein
MALQRSSATPLALAWSALIVYASLYPFSDWRALPAAAPLEWLVLPWRRYWGGFDVWANLLGYLPLGALLCGALVRSGMSQPRALLLALVAGAALSLTMEELQNFLPQRVPSAKDLTLNSAGTLIGALFAAALHRGGWVEHWQATRERWFIASSAGALALLLLWPVGLLFPPPVPLGLGHAIARLPALAAQLLEGSSMAPLLDEWLPGFSERVPSLRLLSPAAETLAIALGLLAPCLLAFSVAQAGWRRLVLPLGAALLGFAATTLSTALNFGPEHMLAWQTRAVAPALVLGLMAAAACAWLPRRAAAGLGLVVLTALVTLVAQAPADPYYADSLQSWEQGRFIRFHGVAQWVGWLWPYAAMLYLLRRVSAASDAG